MPKFKLPIELRMNFMFSSICSILSPPVPKKLKKPALAIFTTNSFEDRPPYIPPDIYVYLTMCLSRKELFPID